MMINYMNNKMSKTFDAPWKSERKYKEGNKTITTHTRTHVGSVGVGEGASGSSLVFVLL